MKRMLLLALLLTVCTVYADDSKPIPPADLRRREQAKCILWHETELTEAEMQLLMELLHNPHPDVVKYAFVVAATRNADHVDKLHAVSTEIQRLQALEPLLTMAGFFLQRTNPLTTEVLAQEIKRLREADNHDGKGNDNEKVFSQKTAADFYQDMLVYLLLREARRTGKPVEIPAGVSLSKSQKTLLEYGVKPERDAWEYLFGKIKALDKSLMVVDGEQRRKLILVRYAVEEAMTAYSKVFFDEVAAVLQSGDVSDMTWEFLCNYIVRAMWLLDEEQEKRLVDMKRQLKRPIGRAQDILWNEVEPTVDDLRELLNMIHSPSAGTSAFALSVLMARCAGERRGLRRIADVILESRLEDKPVTRQMAEYIKKERGVVTVKSLRETLKHEKVPRDDLIGKPVDCYRNVLVYLLLCEARKSGQKPDVFKDVHWEDGQYNKLKYAFKPEKEAWNYLVSYLETDPNKKYYENPNDFFGPSLSSYSKVFFEEAMTAIRAESTSNMARSAMILYLSFNLERLDERQFQQLWDVLKELKMPWYILWWY